MKQEFERIYAEDRWGGGCGPGSTLEATVAYRRFVEEFIRCNEVRTVLDIGCGDGTVAAAIDWSNAHYIGIDIVPKLIEASAARRREGMEFRLLDATSDPLPDADLVLIKEVLQHWTNREILDFLPRLQRYRHVLVVNDVGTVRDPNRISPALNSDTFLDAGCRYRPVDLTSAPFSIAAEAVLTYVAMPHVKCVQLIRALRLPHSYKSASKQIPNIYHFCFGFAEDFAGIPFSLPHYLAVVSCHEVNRPDAIYFHYKHEPSGVWWERAKPYLTLVQAEPPTEIFGIPIRHSAHRADVFRLQTLAEKGGIYLDIDVICLRPFEPLRDHTTVMGEELGVGLCNAVILAAPESPFVTRWLDYYRTFRNEHWNHHSVVLPRHLASRYPSEVHVLDHRKFFWPMYGDDHLRRFYAGVDAGVCRDSYCVHLWEHLIWEEYLGPLTPAHLTFGDSEFANLTRSYVTPYAAECGSAGLRFELGGGGWRRDGVLTVGRHEFCNVHGDFWELDQLLPIDGRVDEFTVAEPLAQVPRDRHGDFLRDLARKLKPGGRVIFGRASHAQ